MTKEHDVIFILVFLSSYGAIYLSVPTVRSIVTVH